MSGILRDSVIVVTGGAGRIGSALVDAILVNGGRAVIAEKDLEAAAVLTGRLGNEYDSDRFFSVSIDICDPPSVDAAVRRIDAQFGRIDALVNNAYPRNSSYGTPFENLGYEDFCDNINMHIGGYFLCCQRFTEYFRQRGGGNIINMGSIYGVIAPRFEIYGDDRGAMPIEYAVIKSGVIHLTRYLAKYLKGSGIRVNAVSPGGIRADQDPEFIRRYESSTINKGMLDASDLSGTIIWLLSDQSAMVNGQNVVIDDGFTL